MRQRKSRGLDYEYKSANKWTKQVKELPKEGTWLPISVVAVLTKYSDVTIRHLCANKVVGAIKFEVGPILVNLEDVKNKWIHGACHIRSAVECQSCNRTECKIRIRPRAKEAAC